MKSDFWLYEMIFMGKKVRCKCFTEKHEEGAS